MANSVTTPKIGPWGPRFVGSHVLLTEAKELKDVPPSWKENLRFDAVDVLFISPFYVGPDPENPTFILGNGSDLNARFDWVVSAARTVKPDIKIIAVQFWREGQHDFRTLDSDKKIQDYAKSVASFISNQYEKRLPALGGSGTVSARIDGFDVDVEESTLQGNLPKIMTAVREQLKSSLGSRPFSVSITPAWAVHMDSSIASSCDYINMQNYDGGENTPPEHYRGVVHGLRPDQLVWGISSEWPSINNEACKAFAGVRKKVDEAANASTGGLAPGIWTWRINSDNILFENIFQVWLYNRFHKLETTGKKLKNPVDDQTLERILEKHWFSFIKRSTCC